MTSPTSRPRRPRRTAGAEPDTDTDADTGTTSRRGARPGRSERSERPATGQKRTVMGVIKELPNFLRLLYGLLTDDRVALVDKALVGGAIAYILLPVDWIPDFIPFLGEVDDVFVLVLALQRLIQNAGRTVVLDHWMGEPGELAELNLQRVLAASAFFLPRRLRRRLRTIGRV